MILTATIFIITIVFLLSQWIRKRYSFFKDIDVPYIQPTFPYGNLKEGATSKHISEVFKSAYDEFTGKAPVCGLFMFIQPVFIILDLDVLRDVMITNFDKFRNRGLYYNVKDDPLSGNVLNLEDNAWRNMRIKLTPTFTAGKMKMMFHTVVDISNQMIKGLDRQNLSNVECKEFLATFTTDVIRNVVFGLENENCEFREVGRKIIGKNGFGGIIKRTFMNTFITFSRKLGLTLMNKEIINFFLKIVQENLNYRIDKNIERNDFFNLLLIKYKSNELTMEEVAAQCFLFFTAGFETSSTTMTFVLYNLALHQDVQDKLRNEIKAGIAKTDGKLTYEGMNEMMYLQMVIDESLRLYTPFPQLGRMATEDYKVPNTNITIPKGSRVSLPFYGIHNNAEYYPEPEKFDPERFTDENKAARHPLAFIPFGDGPRNCIGLRFGLMQTKIGIIQLLLKYRFHPNAKTLVPMKPEVHSLVYSPRGGMWLRLEKL